MLAHLPGNKRYLPQSRALETIKERSRVLRKPLDPSPKPSGLVRLAFSNQPQAADEMKIESH